MLSLLGLVVLHGLDALPEGKERVVDVPCLLHPDPCGPSLAGALRTGQVNYGDPMARKKVYRWYILLLINLSNI